MPVPLPKIDQMHMRNQGWMNGAFPEQHLDGLNADWDFPIMSQQERIAAWSKIIKRDRKRHLPILSIGIVILILDFLFIYYYPQFCEPFGLIFALGAGLILGPSMFLIADFFHYNRALGDEQLVTTALWKSINEADMIKALNEFIESNNEPYSRISNPPTIHPGKTRWWSNKFIFKDGVELSEEYNRFSEKSIARELRVIYNGTNYLHARVLQRKIDTFLTDQNLLVTADWKLEQF